MLILRIEANLGSGWCSIEHHLNPSRESFTSIQDSNGNVYICLSSHVMKIYYSIYSGARELSLVSNTITTVSITNTETGKMRQSRSYQRSQIPILEELSHLSSVLSHHY